MVMVVVMNLIGGSLTMHTCSNSVCVHFKYLAVLSIYLNITGKIN